MVVINPTKAELFSAALSNHKPSGSSFPVSAKECRHLQKHESSRKSRKKNKLSAPYSKSNETSPPSGGWQSENIGILSQLKKRHQPSAVALMTQAFTCLQDPRIPASDESSKKPFDKTLGY